jgi:L-alanine-DL-glutamate epimerase-like enolase superfamily enzyme
MGKAWDVQVEAVDLRLSDERLATPLLLSRGAITEITYARVAIQVRTRAGLVSRGEGAILLSDVWAFPDPAYSHAQKDALMRALCEAIAVWLRCDGDFEDPLEKGYKLEQTLPQLVRQIERDFPFLAPGAFPYLAALNCLSPFDAAVHDAWGRALGAPVYAFYDTEWLNADLGYYLGAAFHGRFPAMYWGKRRTRLAVQHVVGIADRLEVGDGDVLSGAAGGLPQTLGWWIRRDGVRCFKVKSHGQDPIADAQRLVTVFEIARNVGIPLEQIHLSLDPNEACPDAAFVLELLDYLAAEAPAVFAALDYIEQPVQRNLARQTVALHEVAARKPVIIDESLDHLENLSLLGPLGWSGLSVKTCKGQTHCLLAYCWGRQNSQFLTLQDLTNPGLALVHSANLCAQLALSVGYFEYNSRQFMPEAALEEHAGYAPYFRVSAGEVQLPVEGHAGLY